MAPTADPVDVLIITALKIELDELLAVTAGLRDAWKEIAGELPIHVASFDGALGPIRIAAARPVRMGSIDTAALATRLIDQLNPQCLAMCGVCAGHPDDTDLGDVVIADRVFLHDYGKHKQSTFEPDIWTTVVHDSWLRVAQDLEGPATGLHGYSEVDDHAARRWLLGRLLDERHPFKSGFSRYFSEDRRARLMKSLLEDEHIEMAGQGVALSPAGHREISQYRVIHGISAKLLPFFVHVGPIGSGNYVAADGNIWEQLEQHGMRKIKAIEMEAAAIGGVAFNRGLPFVVAKGVMDHADAKKADGFKNFASRASAEVLCRFLRRVVRPRQSEAEDEHRTAIPRVQLEQLGVVAPPEISEDTQSEPKSEAEAPSQGVAARPAGTRGEPLDLHAFIDLMFKEDPESWRLALTNEREQLQHQSFSRTTVARILERAAVHRRDTLTWLRWLESFEAYFRPADLARVCREIGLLHEASDPALVLSRLCHIVNSPAKVVTWSLLPFAFRGVHQLVLREYLGKEQRGLLATASFAGCYLVGLDARGVELPRAASAWAGADLRFADLDPRIDTSLALREIGSIRALDLPVAGGGSMRAVRLASGAIVSEHADGSLRVWSAAGPLERTLWIGDPAWALSGWGDALATEQWKTGLARRTLDGSVSWAEGIEATLSASLCELADGRLAVAGQDGVVRICSPDPLVIDEEVPTGQSSVTALCAADCALLWGAQDGSIGVHPLGEGDEQIMRGEEGRPIRKLASLDSQRFVAANHDGLVRIWSKQGDELDSFDNEVEVTAIVSMLEGFALGDVRARIRLWRDRERVVEELAKVPGGVWGLVTLDEQRLWSVSERRLQVWTTAGELRREVRDGAYVRAAAINDEAVAWIDDEKRVWALRVEESGRIQLCSTNALDARSVQIDGTRIYAVNELGYTLSSWSGHRHARPTRISRAMWDCKLTTFVPWLEGVAFGTTNKGVRTVRGDRMRFRSYPESESRPEVDALAVSPDGQRLAVAYRGGVIELHGTEQRFELVPNVERISSLCWLRDEQLVAAHEGGLTCISISNGESEVVPSPKLSCLARGHGHALLAGTVDGAVLLWSALDQAPCRLQAHDHELLAVFERKDGTVVTAASDGLRFWSPEGSLREQLNVLSESVIMWIRPGDDWPIALESLEAWSRQHDWGDQIYAWVNAFVTDKRRDDDPDAPMFRVPLSALRSDAWRWEEDTGIENRSVIRLRWPEHPGFRRALQRALLGPHAEEMEANSSGESNARQ